MFNKDTAARFSAIVDELCQYPEVNFGSGGKKGFGSSALKIHGKIFAMISSGDKFVVKLPKPRVDSLITAGSGERFDANHGRWMKEWVVIKPDAGESWLALTKEALAFVASML